MQQQYLDERARPLAVAELAARSLPEAFVGRAEAPVRPCLSERNRAGQRAGLARQHFEVVVEHEHLGALAHTALVAGDLAALGVHGERRAAEAHVDRAAGAGRRHRVARAAHRDARLAVGLRPQRDRGVERLGGKGSQRRTLGLRRRTLTLPKSASASSPGGCSWGMVTSTLPDSNSRRSQPT